MVGQGSQLENLANWLDQISTNPFQQVRTIRVKMMVWPFSWTKTVTLFSSSKTVFSQMIFDLFRVWTISFSGFASLFSRASGSFHSL